MADADPGSTLTAEIGFTIADERVDMKVTVPRGPIDPVRILPLAQALSNLVVDKSVRRHGQAISCRKGCSRCCDQLVPVTTIEARALAEHVAKAPPEQRAAWESRFDAALARVESAGLPLTLEDLTASASTQAMAMGAAYFALGVACPFLEDGACSVHPVRPTICREYLVTTDPQHCADPSPERVQRVPMAAQVSQAVARTCGDASAGGGPRWLALIAILRWAARQPPAEPRPGPDLLRELFAQFSEKPLPAPPGLGSA